MVRFTAKPPLGHLVTRSTLPIFRAEAANQWRGCGCSRVIAHPASGWFLLTIVYADSAPIAVPRTIH